MLLATLAAIAIAPQTAFRGAMVAPMPNREDLAEFGRDWKANLIRWQLQWEGFPRSKADEASISEFRAWLETALKRFDECLPTCKEVGLKVVLDLHTGPGGRDANFNCRLLQKPELADEFVRIWQDLARRYKGNRTIWAFDLLNEATTSSEDVVKWPDLALRAAKAIREIDPQRTIVFEPAPWADSSGFKDLKPLPIKNVVYSPHFYNPHQFTHQGVFENPMGYNYPGEIAGEKWDKARLAKVVEPVDVFQRKHNVPIYVGEFSAIRWAPGDSGLRYLADVIDLFESRGWDWTYHAFREWEGWSVEHGPDKNDNARLLTTPRKNLLLKWFAKNRR